LTSFSDMSGGSGSTPSTAISSAPSSSIKQSSRGKKNHSSDNLSSSSEWSSPSHTNMSGLEDSHQISQQPLNDSSSSSISVSPTPSVSGKVNADNTPMSPNSRRRGRSASDDYVYRSMNMK
jgi:hypothetical protein